MNKFAPKDYKSSIDHIREDILPYIYCCKAGKFSMCDSYYQRRPSDNGAKYQPPPPGIVHKVYVKYNEISNALSPGLI